MTTLATGKTVAKYQQTAKTILKQPVFNVFFFFQFLTHSYHLNFVNLYKLYKYDDSSIQ